MKHVFRKTTVFTLAMVITMAGASCSKSSPAVDVNSKLNVSESTYGVLYNGKPYTLRIDLNTLMPSANKEDPNGLKAAQVIADNFMAMFPNVKIEWDRTKGTDWPYWMTTQLAAGTAPDICFLQGSQYADRGWFIRLNEYLDKANPFIDGNTKWRSIFPDYVWDNYLTTDAAGNNVAVPLTLYPGTATAYYYNKTIFKKLNITVPTEWNDFVKICKTINNAGYVAVAPWKANTRISIDLWDIQFSLGPTFSYSLKDSWDIDKSGTMSQYELLRAAYKGVFDLKSGGTGMAMYDLVKEKYTDILQDGAATTDYENLWNKGKVAMMEDGLWRLPTENANTDRDFDFGMFPVPEATTVTSKFATDVKYETGIYNPPIHESYQLVKNTVEKKGEGAKDVCVRFIQWLTTPENLNLIIEEGEGAYIGAVKGTMIPSALDEWLKNKFPRIPNSQWVMWPTTDAYLRMSKQLEMYVRGMVDEKTFIAAYNAELKKGVSDQISGLGINTAQLK